MAKPPYSNIPETIEQVAARIHAGDDDAALRLFREEKHSRTFAQIVPLYHTGSGAVANTEIAAHSETIREAAARVIAKEVQAFLHGPATWKEEIHYQQEIEKPARFFGVEPSDLSHALRGMPEAQTPESLNYAVMKKLVQIRKNTLAQAKEQGDCTGESLVQLYADLYQQYAQISHLPVPAAEAKHHPILLQEKETLKQDMKPEILGTLANKVASLSRAVKRKPSTWDHGVDDTSRMLLAVAEIYGNDHALTATREKILASPALTRGLLEISRDMAESGNALQQLRGAKLFATLYPAQTQAPMTPQALKQRVQEALSGLQTSQQRQR